MTFDRVTEQRKPIFSSLYLSARKQAFRSFDTNTQIENSHISDRPEN